MKKNWLLLALGVGVLAALNSTAKIASPATSNPYLESLKGVTPLELPAKAASIVAAATEDRQELVAISVLQAAVVLKPATARAVVGAISKAVPRLAPVVAAGAAHAQPKEAPFVAWAAAAAAPAQVSQIVFAVCSQTPRQFRNVAFAAATAVRHSDAQILEAISAAIPSVKPTIEQFRAANGAQNHPVFAVLNLESTARALRLMPLAPAPVLPNEAQVMGPAGPAAGPPFVGISTPPGEFSISATGFVPPLGRRYAAP